MKFSTQHTLSVLFSLIGSVHGRLNERRQSAEEEFHVIIGMKNESNGLKIVSKLSRLIRPRFKRINAVSAVVSQWEWDQLKRNPNILYVQEDGMIYPNGEAMLYGLDMVQAASSLIPSNSATSTAACNDPKSFKIGVSFGATSQIDTCKLFHAKKSHKLCDVCFDTDYRFRTSSVRKNEK